MEEPMTADQQTIKEKIKKLQKEKDVVILAHYYVDGEVQEIQILSGIPIFLPRKQ